MSSRSRIWRLHAIRSEAYRQRARIAIISLDDRHKLSVYRLISLHVGFLSTKPVDTVSVSEHIAEFVTTNLTDIEASAGALELAEVMSVLKLSLLDWASVANAVTDEPVSTIVRDLATSDGGSSESHVFGSEHALPARAAAMVNGATSHALDYDDTHFMHIGHTGVVVFATTLAVAEQQQLSGKEFLEAA